VSAPDAAREEGGGGVFSPLTAVLMVLVGVFAFCALVVLVAYAPDLESGNNGQGHALSKSAVGFAGIVKALRLEGDPVVVNRAPIRAGRHSGLLIVTPGPTTDRRAIDALTFGGPVLVVTPKWLTVPDLTHRGWVGKADVIDPAAVPKSFMGGLTLRRRSGTARPVLRGAGGAFPPDQSFPVGLVASLQSIGAPGWIPVLTDETGATILARDAGSPADRPLYVLSDPDLLDTQGVADVDTLGAGLSILRGLRARDGAFIFDVRLNGLGKERSALRLLFDPPFLAVTLCLAAAAALAGWQAFCRFGPVRRGGRVIALGKTALVENTAALIRLAGREYRMGGRYADLTADLTARAVGAPRGLGGEALTAFLDRLSIRRGLPDALSELAIQARMARTAPAVAAAASRLFQWRMAMTGEDRPGLTRSGEAGSLTPDSSTPDPSFPRGRT
jgi:hypothetical protein